MDVGRKREFGDFQTPPELAALACRRIATLCPTPQTIVEPSCGQGSFLLAALDQFPAAQRVLGVEINAAHISELETRLRERRGTRSVVLRHGDFFQLDWTELLQSAAEPVLVIGNPPWVTNSDLGTMASTNLPRKTNVDHLAGLAALTGKSNFDVSQWLLRQLGEQLDGRCGTLAMLCKTAVARKVLAGLWNQGCQIDRAELVRIDAARWFGAAVDACLLVCRFASARHSARAAVFANLDARHPDAWLGWRDGTLVADADRYERWRWLRAEDRAAGRNSRPARFESTGDGDAPLIWRSGIKHDCAAVMELRNEGRLWRNGLGERVDVEPCRVFPLIKGSDVAHDRVATPARSLLVTQHSLQSETADLQQSAPRTWAYLLSHAARLDGRKSSIYRGRARFAQFGVGPYAFAPYKVAACGLYKSPRFCVVGPVGGQPVCCDDTIYFLPSDTRAVAESLATLLDSQPAREFFASQLFPDAKRPLTAELLRRLDLPRLAAHLGIDLSAPLTPRPEYKSRRLPERSCPSSNSAETDVA